MFMLNSTAQPKGQVCSEEGCNRPAVSGMERMDGTNVYYCAPHNEIGLLGGQLDWLDGEIGTLEDWLNPAKKQATNLSEEAANGRMLDNYPSLLILANKYVTYKQEKEEYLPYSLGSSWVVCLESLLAAIRTAEELTREKIAGMEAELK
jgi:hypothetical protein